MAERPPPWLLRAIGGAAAGVVVGLAMAAAAQAEHSRGAWVALLTLDYLAVVTWLSGCWRS